MTITTTTQNSNNGNNGNGNGNGKKVRLGRPARNLQNQVASETLPRTAFQFSEVLGSKVSLPNQWDCRQRGLSLLVSQQVQRWASNGRVTKQDLQVLFEQAGALKQNTAKIAPAAGQSNKAIQLQCVVATLQQVANSLLELVVPGHGLRPGYGKYSVNIMTKKMSIEQAEQRLQAAQQFTLPAGRAFKAALKVAKQDLKNVMNEQQKKAVQTSDVLQVTENSKAITVTK